MENEQNNNVLTHLDRDGSARMVDVSGKPVSLRSATAKGSLLMSAQAAELVKSGPTKKGDVFQIARIAAIQSTKLASQLIPLCHVLPLEKVAVQFDWVETCKVECTVEVLATAKTGVEMEALTAVSVGLLTVYDMLKAVDRSMEIQNIALWAKDGGISGSYRRESLT